MNHVQDLRVYEGQSLQSESLTAKQVVSQVRLIQEVMNAVMKEGEHYGKIPGCGDKPALLKAGAEKLASTFRFAPKYEEVIGSREDDEIINYKIRCDLIHIPTNLFAGSGMGTCNSREKKYRDRFVYADKATDEEKAIGKLTERNGKNGKFQVYIIPQNPWDLQNTIYKMACKRALVAAVLNATAASDIFSQDLDEMDSEDIAKQKPASEPFQKPQRKYQSKQSDNKKPYWVSEHEGKKYIWAKLEDFSSSLLEGFGMRPGKSNPENYFAAFSEGIEEALCRALESGSEASA